MRLTDHQKLEYGCRDTQELLALLVLCPEELTIGERSEVYRHLTGCSACRRDFETLRQTGHVLLAGRGHLQNIGAANPDSRSVDLSHDEVMGLRFQTRLERAVIRRKRRERKARMVQIKRVAGPIAAVAACLVAVCILYQIATVRITYTPTALVESPDHSIRIELLTERVPKNWTGV